MHAQEGNLQVNGRCLNSFQKGKQVSSRHPPDILRCLKGYLVVTFSLLPVTFQSPDLEKLADHAQMSKDAWRGLEGVLKVFQRSLKDGFTTGHWRKYIDVTFFWCIYQDFSGIRCSTCGYTYFRWLICLSKYAQLKTKGDECMIHIDLHLTLDLLQNLALDLSYINQWNKSVQWGPKYLNKIIMAFPSVLVYCRRFNKSYLKEIHASAR